MTVTKTERRIVETMLAFANLPRIESPDQVQAVFRGLPFAWLKRHDWVQDVPVAAFRKDQRRVRRWLAGIARRNPRSLRRVAADVNRVLARTTHVVLHIDPQTLTVTLDRYLTGGSVEEFCALGAAYLFDLRLLRRVRQCPLEGCGRHRVTFAGRVWHYCSVEHQHEGERLKARERVKQWRALGSKRNRTGREQQ